jgi:hypothetical protein
MEETSHQLKLEKGNSSNSFTKLLRIIRSFMNGEIKIVKAATELKAREANK